MNFPNVVTPKEKLDNNITLHWASLFYYTAASFGVPFIFYIFKLVTRLTM